jgi:hypothetical protein
MSFSRPIQWYLRHVDPSWPEGTFNCCLFDSAGQLGGHPHRAHQEEHPDHQEHLHILPRHFR